MLIELRRDFERLYPGRNPHPLKYAEAALTHPGFLACLLYRFQTSLFNGGQKRSAAFLRVVNNSLTGADMLPGSRIGPGLVLHHPIGVVVGHGVIAGEDLTLLQGVTLGEKYVSGDNPHLYPQLGDGVVIGAGAAVLGPVKLSDSCQVAALAVVLSDVPAGALAVGQPAQLHLR